MVDQFEEVFTQCRSDEERKGFFDSLLAACDPADEQPIQVVIVLRADFYANLARMTACANGSRRTRSSSAR